MTSGQDQSGQGTGGGTRAGTPAGTAHDTSAGTGPGQYVPRPAPQYDDTTAAAAEPSGAAVGLRFFAALLLIMSGVWNFLGGLAGIIKGSFVVVLPNYTYSMSAVSWGWFHLILGVVVFATGCALIADMLWARVLGIAFATLSAVVNFLYIPYQPVWSIVLIAIDVAVIWALLTPRRGYV